MTAWLFGMLACIAALVLESWCGAYGFLVPWSAMVIFYLTVVYGWRVGLVAALGVGFLLDRIFLRHGMPSMPGTLLAMGIGMLWLWRADSRVVWLRLLPGVGIALTAAIPGTIVGFFCFGATADRILQGLLSCLFIFLLTPVLTLVLTLVLDDAAAKLGLPLFEKARERFIHNRE